MPLTVKKLDGRSLKALAHPLRMRIVGSLRHDGPATATLLGTRLGESSGLTSYHVRVLAENGFVEEAADRGTGRERWWQAAQDMTSWRPEDFRDDPDEREAEEWVTGYAARRGMEWLDEWLHRRPDAEPAWVDAADTSDYFLTLTPGQLRTLMAEISELVLRHRDQSLAAEPDDARRSVTLLTYAFPRQRAEEQTDQPDEEADDG
jgi:DNA-binding transcriptional ArsR family regulator